MTGNQKDVQVAGEMIKCPQCGTLIHSKAAICYSCGYLAYREYKGEAVSIIPEPSGEFTFFFSVALVFAAVMALAWLVQRSL